MNSSGSRCARSGLLSAAAHGLQLRNKLQVKVSCQRLTASLCLRAVSLVTLSLRLVSRSHLEPDFILLSPHFTLTLVKTLHQARRDFFFSPSSPLVCPALGDVAWVPGALLHSPGAAETSGSLLTASLRFLRRAKMSRFKADLFDCNRLRDRLSSTV